MSSERIDVIATTISGSIKDWSKVERIVPLFAGHGIEDVRLQAVDSHRAAREQASRAIADGARILISAGGSGTFNAVLEGCCDSGLPLGEIRLGFLRKGSADLIGKVLGMSDEIEAAIAIFADSIRAGRTLPCDLLRADCPGSQAPARNFVGYGGAGIFGRIPHFTENRFMKWYKGVLSQLFGDLGPFTTGLALAVIELLLKRPFVRRRCWRLRVDGKLAAEGAYHALIIVNGYLGPELAFSDDTLGSQRFHLFALRDMGLRSLPGQLKAAHSGAIAADPERWGMEHYAVIQELELDCGTQRSFPLNVDGSTLPCGGVARVRRVDQIRLISRD